MAKKIEEISYIVVSTDDSTMAREAETYGALVPSLRPSHLAQDKTPMVDVIRYVLNSLGSSYPNIQFPEHYQGVVLLQPTSPMRKLQHIRDAIHIYSQYITENKEVPGIMAVSPVPQEHYLHNLWEAEDPSTTISPEQGIMLKKSQTPLIQDSLFYRNGAVVVLHPEKIDALTLSCGPVIPYLIQESLVSIDSEQDLLAVEHCGRPLEPSL